jgi:hypothetical protein
MVHGGERISPQYLDLEGKFGLVLQSDRICKCYLSVFLHIRTRRVRVIPSARGIVRHRMMMQSLDLIFRNLQAHCKSRYCEHKEDVPGSRSKLLTRQAGG